MARALILAIWMAAGAKTGAAQPAAEAGAVPNPPAPEQAFPAERRIALRHHWTREELNVVYRIGDDYQPEALAAINRLMRDYRCNKETQIDPKLVDLLYELHQELGGHGPIRVISAFRSEGYNASLLRAGRTVDPDSQHTLGRAADVIFPGVKADRVRAAAEAKGLGGVGYYPYSGPVFVHVDTGPVRHWVETDPKARRAMGLTGGRRKRFVLDCSLTTDAVLAEISAERAYAALPPGASAKPHPSADVLRTALAAGSGAFGLPQHHHMLLPKGSVNIQAEHGPACFGWEPLARLALLRQEEKEETAVGKRQAGKRHKAKVKASAKSARRSAKAKGRGGRKEASVRSRSRKR